MHTLPSKQIISGIIIALAVFVIIIELVRRRKLREEYSWFWLLTGVMLLFVVLKYDFLMWLTRLVGARVPTSALFFFGLLFVIILCLQYAVRISSLDGKIRILTQEVALLKFDLEQAVKRKSLEMKDGANSSSSD